MKPRTARTAEVVLGVGLCFVVMIALVWVLCSRPEAEPPVPPSPVAVGINSIDPSPACIGDPIDGTATAAVRADGGWLVPANSTVEYRWRWEFLGDGRVATVAPALDPTDVGWTLWHSDGRCTVTASFPSCGQKTVKCTVQARVVAGGEAPGAVVAAVAVRDLTVINLQGSPRVFVVSRNIGEVTLGWAQSPSPGVAGYKYHIEPYPDVLYDVGNVTQVRITGLTPGKEYSIHVHAYDAAGHTTR